MKIKNAFLALVFLMPLFSIAENYGKDGLLTKEAIEAMRASAAESQSAYKASDAESNLSDSDILDAIGIGTISAAGLKSANSLKVTRSGKDSIFCEDGARMQVGDLKLRVLSCNEGQMIVAACDAESNGFLCEPQCEEGDLACEKSTGRYEREVHLYKDLSLAGAPFFGTHKLNAVCSDVACTVDVNSEFDQAISTSATGSSAAGYQAREDHKAKDSLYRQQMGWSETEEMEEYKKFFEDEELEECYELRRQELVADGKVRSSCDPNNVETLLFAIERREGENQGQMMCDRSEEGVCSQPIAIQDVQTMSGQQTCTAELSPSKQSCYVENHPVLNPVDPSLSERHSSCGVGCYDIAFGKVGSAYWGGRCGSPYTASTKVRINNPESIQSAVIDYLHVDDNIRIYILKPGERPSANNRVFDSHPDLFNTCRDAGYRTDVNPNVNITSHLANAKPGEVLEFYVEVKVIGTGHGYGSFKIKFNPSMTYQTTTCGSLDKQAPGGTSATGCYRTNTPAGVCLDKKPRVINGITFSPSCWKYQKDYTCYNGPITGCATTSLQNNGWVKQKEQNHQYPTSTTGQNVNQPWKWDEVWTYTGTNGLSNEFGCAAPSPDTTHTDATGGEITTTHQWCYTEYTKECNPSPAPTKEELTQCRVVNTKCLEEDKGLCVKQEQEYFCETQYLCENAFGNTMVDDSIKPDNLNALGKIVAESEKAKAISEALSGNSTVDENGNIILFDGTLRQCRKWSRKAIDIWDMPVNFILKNMVVSIFGQFDKDKRDCCQGNPDNIDLGANFKNCRQSDIELAASRMAQAAHLIELDQAAYSESSIEESDEDVDTRATEVCVVAEKKQSGSVNQWNYMNISWSGDTSAQVSTRNACNAHVQGSGNDINFCMKQSFCKNYVKPKLSAVRQAFFEAAGGVENCTNSLNDIVGTVTINRPLGSIAAGTYQEPVFDNLIANEMNANTSIYRHPVGQNGNERYCFKHLSFDYRALVYKDANGEYVIDDDGEKIYLSSVQIDPPQVSLTGEGNWLPGNKAMCSWWLNVSQLGHLINIAGMQFNVAKDPENGIEEITSTVGNFLVNLGINVGTSALAFTGGTIWAPGSYSNQADWLFNFDKILDLPFNCQYMLGDIADTIRVDSYQSWCAFDNVFSKIVHEQGRKQLAEYATRPYTGAVTDSQSFSFYKDGEGAWTNSKVVNGNDIRFWQWPSRCDPSEAKEEDSSKFDSHFVSKSFGKSNCPTGADVFIAVCDKAGSCGDLPFNPLLESTAWDVRQLRAEDDGLNAITQLLVTQGGCTAEGECKYNLHAWKKGVGGSVDIPVDFSWPLVGAQEGWVNYASHNSIHFVAYSAPIGTSNAAPQIKMCVGSAQDCDNRKISDTNLWKNIQLNNPTSLTGQDISSSPAIKAIGQCDEKTKYCSYRLTINVKLKAKPWHNGITYETYSFRLRPKIFGKPIGPKHRTHYNYKIKADCSGFSLDEFLALDLTAMDLTEFTDMVAKEAEQKLTEMMNDGTIENAIENVDKVVSGEKVGFVGTGTKNFDLTPTNGFAGEVVSFVPLYADENHSIAVIEDKDIVSKQVTKLQIDWGDGFVEDYGPAQEIKHTYGARSTPQTADIKGKVTWFTTGGKFSEGFTFKLWASTPGLLPGGGQNTNTEKDGTDNVFGSGSLPRH